MAAEIDAVRLAQHFADRVITEAGLPAARRNDVYEACEIAIDPNFLRLTCTITGSTYESEWDGTEFGAMQLVVEAADSTAYVLTRTRHYAWIRSSR